MSSKNTAAPVVAPAVAPDVFDAAEVGRTFGRLRAEVSMLVQDARRRSPYFARTPDEAIAKRDAAMKVLKEFADRLDALKAE